MTEVDFDELYATTARPLLAYLLRRVPAEDAADLLAETMTIAWTRRADLPSETERTPWLFGVARNLMSAHHRRGSQQRRLISRLAETVAPAVPQPDPNRLDLSRALRRLRPLDAEILTLAAWEGFTSVEIGIMLGLPAATVRTRMRRARARLRTMLGLVPVSEEPRPARPATQLTAPVVD